MARIAVDRKDARAILRRLEQYVETVHEGNWDHLHTTIRIGRTTVSGWKHKGRQPGPVPDLPSLLKLARLGQLSIDWLMHDHGPMLLKRIDSDAGEKARSVPEQTRDDLVGELAAQWGKSRDRVDSSTPAAPFLWQLIRRHIGESVEAIEERRQEFDDLRKWGRWFVEQVPTEEMEEITRRKSAETDRAERKALGNLDLPFLKSSRTKSTQRKS